MASVSEKLGLDEAAYSDLLHQLYWDHELSQRQISLRLGVHRTTIEQHFKKFSIATRPYTECDIWQRKICELTATQFEILDGMLLADGHLDSSPISARLTYGCKFRETLCDIAVVFPQLHFSNLWCSKHDHWHFKSSYYRDLKPQHDRWYVNKIKRVPVDMRLTPLSCYWWFVGDGYQVDYGLCFCTDVYDRESIECLRYKFHLLGFDTSVTPSTNRIRVRGKSAPRLLEWMRNNVVISVQYLYKWGSHRRQCK